MQEKFVFAKGVSAKGRFQGFLARFRTPWILNSRTDKGMCGRRNTVKCYVLHSILLSEVFSLEDISVYFVNAHWSQKRYDFLNIKIRLNDINASRIQQNTS